MGTVVPRLDTHNAGTAGPISKLLLDAGIFPVLWGEAMLRAWGVWDEYLYDHGSEYVVDFVVDDDRVAEARRALRGCTRLRGCDDEDYCPISCRSGDGNGSGGRLIPAAPEFHLHGRYYDVAVHKASDVFWYNGVPASSSAALYRRSPPPEFCVVPSRHQTRSGCETDVVLPAPHAVVESYVRLAHRHGGARDGRGSFFLGLVEMIWSRARTDGLWVDEDLMSDTCRRAWRDLLGMRAGVVQPRWWTLSDLESRTEVQPEFWARFYDFLVEELGPGGEALCVCARW